MKYQLVLQWPASSIRDYDDIVQIEDILIASLSKEHEVDGHDAGVGKINIFIQTNSPRDAFNKVRTILGSRDFWLEARVAFREIKGSNYTILWPSGLFEFKVA